MMFISCISGNASALESRRSWGTSSKKVPLDLSLAPNVASINDMVVLAPNVAFVPSKDNIIEYNSLPDDEQNSNQSNDVDVAMNSNNTDTKKSSNEKEKVEDKKQADNLKTSIPTLRPDEVSKNVASVNRQLDLVKKKLPKNNSNIVKKDNAFPDINPKEGEEVLVSVSKTLEENIKQKNNEALTKQEIAKSIMPEAFNPDDYFEEENNDAVNSSNDNPFGVEVKNLASNDVKINSSTNKKPDISFGQSNNPFVKAFSAIRPEKPQNNIAQNNKKKDEKVIAQVSSKNLKQDLYHTYLSDNQYLSPVEYYNDTAEFLQDEAEEQFFEDAVQTQEQFAEDEDFKYDKNVGDALEGDVGPVNVNKIREKLTKTKKSVDLPSGPLKVGNREVLQMKLEFEPNSSAISGESVNIIRSFAQIATDQPTNSIQIAISQNVMNDTKAKKLAARRLAIVSNVLRNAGIADKQINPVLTNRDIDSFSFRVVNNDNFEKLRISKGKDMFGEDENVQEYNLMRW